MKSANRNFLIAALVLAMIGFFGTGLASAGGPTLTLSATEVDLAKETNVKLSGTGFKPGAAVMILFTDENDVPLDIGWALDPEPKADANGEWATTWDAKRYIQKKMIKAGEYTIAVTDDDYNELDSKNIKFVGKYQKKKKKKK